MYNCFKCDCSLQEIDCYMAECFALHRDTKVMILSFRTDRSANSADPDHTDQGQHCLQFRVHLLGALLFGKAILFNFRVITANVLGVQNFRIFTV